MRIPLPQLETKWFLDSSSLSLQIWATNCRIWSWIPRTNNVHYHAHMEQVQNGISLFDIRIEPYKSIRGGVSCTSLQAE
jgi:hypothetical protein